jgi:hypothetical protein
MIVNVYVVIDPNGDRPYVSTTEPAHLDKKGGTIKVHHYMLQVPDAQPPDTMQLVPQLPET